MKNNWPPFELPSILKIKSNDKLKMKLSHWSKITHWLCLTSKKQTHMLPYFENFNSNFITLLSPRMLSIQNYHYYFHCHLRYSFKLKFLLNLQGGSPKILCHVTSDVKLSHFLMKVLAIVFYSFFVTMHRQPMLSSVVKNSWNWNFLLIL